VPGDACMLLCPAHHRPVWPTVSGPAAWESGVGGDAPARPAGSERSGELAGEEQARQARPAPLVPSASLPVAVVPRRGWPAGFLGARAAPAAGSHPEGVRGCRPARRGGLQFASSQPTVPMARPPTCDALY